MSVVSTDKMNEMTTLTFCQQQILLPIEHREQTQLVELFFLAAEKNWPSVIDCLVDNGAVEVNHRYDGDEETGLLNHAFENSTALMSAAEAGHDAVVKTLLEKNGIEINAMDSMGYTALMLAAAAGRHEAVKILLKHGDIEVNHENNNGETALMLAIYQDESAVKNILLKNGANEKAILTFCQKQTSLSTGRNQGKFQRYFILAAHHNWPSVIDWLITNHIISVNYALSDGTTALMVAALSGHQEMVQTLLAKGADVNLITKKNGTALMLATKENHLNIVALLLKSKDIQKEVPWRIGKTSLFIDLENEKLDAESIQVMLDTLRSNKKQSALIIFWQNSGHEQFAQQITEGLKEHESLMMIHFLNDQQSDAIKQSLLEVNTLLRRNHINETQKNVIEGTMSFYFSSITEAFASKPENAILAFQAMMSTETISKEDQDVFNLANVWEDTISAVRNVLSHSCPQNRQVGDPYAAFLSADGVLSVNGIPHVYWLEPHPNVPEQKIERREQQGLLGLTAKNDATAPNITQKAVVKTIHGLIKVEIAKQEQILNDASTHRLIQAVVVKTIHDAIEAADSADQAQRLSEQNAPPPVIIHSTPIQQPSSLPSPRRQPSPPRPGTTRHHQDSDI